MNRMNGKKRMGQIGVRFDHVENRFTNNSVLFFSILQNDENLLWTRKVSSN